MQNINGTRINGLPYNLRDYVGDLLFAEYSSTIIFSDENGNPIVKEWVDCSEDNKVDRFFYFETSKIKLREFLDGVISHLDLINSSKNQFVIFQDESNAIPSNTVQVPVNMLPEEYKPAYDFYFNASDGVDVNVIISYFSLNEIGLVISNTALVREISKRNRAETLYIKVNKGKGVGFGTINTEIFGKTLVNFDKFYKNVALDYLLGKNRGEISLDAKKNEEYLEFTETELYENSIRASYGFLIKPAALPKMNLFDNETEAEKIAKKVFSLFLKSKTSETLKDEYLLHSGFTIKSYKHLLEGVLKAQLNIDFNWFSPFNGNEIFDHIDYKVANGIITLLENLSTTDSTEFKVKGKFRAVNCDTSHYYFSTLDEQSYTGYFDAILKEGLIQINFIDIYEVLIVRTVIKEADRSGDKITNKILSFVIDK